MTKVLPHSRWFNGFLSMPLAKRRRLRMDMVTLSLLFTFFIMEDHE